MNITQLTKPTVSALRTSLNADLAKIAAKHGITISLGNCRFTAHNAEFKLSLAVIGVDGTAKTKEATDFEFFAPRAGIKLKVGEVFTSGGRRFTLTGWARKGQTYKVLATHGGKGYKFPTRAVVTSNENHTRI